MSIVQNLRAQTDVQHLAMPSSMSGCSATAAALATPARAARYAATNIRFFFFLLLLAHRLSLADGRQRIVGGSALSASAMSLSALSAMGGRVSVMTCGGDAAGPVFFVWGAAKGCCS